MAERVALVTGGARGIGWAVALDLARTGWAVAVGYRASEAAAEEVRAAIEAAGARALAVRGDVSDPDAARALVREVEAAWGRIDALVQCAGPFHRVPLLEETPAGWRAMLEGNLDPLFHLGQAVAPGMMRRRYGRIVAFGLASAERLGAQPNLTAYAIAKAGVVGLVRTWARVLAPYGITVNAVSPGLLDSGGLPRAELDPLVSRIPAGHLGRVDDAVAAVRFFLSDEAAYVTGANLPVSGGWGI
jgi:3-oxoacyl-[acyl-carrier protein] reductase